MDWIDITVKKPRQRQDCVVLTERGSVERAIAHKGWSGGFCSGDGEDGVCVQRVTHWIPFKTPNAKVSGAGTASAGLPGYAGDNNGD